MSYDLPLNKPVNTKQNKNEGILQIKSFTNKVMRKIYS